MELDLSNSSLTESELIHIAHERSNLTQVSLSAARGLSDISCSSLLESCHKLVYLDLSFCSNITDKAFEGMHDPLLKILNLKGCDKLTDRALLAIATGCKNLNGLYLAYCSQITDKGLFAFTDTAIATLDLSRCSKITEKGVLHMVEQCKHLTSLNLIETRVSENCRQKIQSMNPALTIIS